MGGLDASKGKNDLFIVALAGNRVAKPLLDTEHDELNATISADGHWMAYQSDLSGQPEVYVRPFPDVNAGQIKVSVAGGLKPAWSPSGRALFYLSTESKMMAVPIDATRGLVPGTPIQLFDASGYFTQGAGRNFDVSHDGTRLMLIKNPERVDGGDYLTMVLNWTADVLAKLPKAGR
jgi:Tol biopolymer transport system component